MSQNRKRVDILVLSNEHYDANEYIRDYKEYKEIMKKECTFIKRK